MTAITTVSIIFAIQYIWSGPSDSTHGKPQNPHTQQQQLTEKQQVKLNNLKNEEIKLLADIENDGLEETYHGISRINLAKQHKLAPTPQQQKPDEDAPVEETIFDRAAQAFSTASSIPDQNNKLQSSAIHNRAALFIRKPERSTFKTLTLLCHIWMKLWLATDNR